MIHDNHTPRMIRLKKIQVIFNNRKKKFVYHFEMKIEIGEKPIEIKYLAEIVELQLFLSSESIG